MHPPLRLFSWTKIIWETITFRAVWVAQRLVTGNVLRRVPSHCFGEREQRFFLRSTLFSGLFCLLCCVFSFILASVVSLAKFSTCVWNVRPPRAVLLNLHNGILASYPEHVLLKPHKTLHNVYGWSFIRKSLHQWKKTLFFFFHYPISLPKHHTLIYIQIEITWL